MKINRREAIKLTGLATTALLGGVTSTMLGGCDNKTSQNSNTNNIISNNMKSNLKVLLVNGSPHKDGCTYTALSEIAKELEKNEVSTEIMWLDKNPISGCIACASCRKTGSCFMNDIVNQFTDKAKDFDGFVFGSPVHYAGASGFITPFMDRAFYSASSNMVCKPGAVIVSCRRAGSTAALDQLNKYITISNMPLVTSQYWNMVHGNTPAEVLQDKEGLQTMRTLGVNMAWLLKNIEAGKKAGISLPKYEERARTNFIR